MLCSHRPTALGTIPVAEIVLLLKVFQVLNFFHRGVSFATGTVINNSLVVVGGRTGGFSTTEKTQIFDGKSWRFGPSLPQPLEQHCTVKLNSTHLMMTGGLENIAPILRNDRAIIFDLS